jgi:hypothetical protein
MNISQGWRSKLTSYFDELVPEAIRKSATPGQTYRTPQTGSTLRKEANGHR